MGQNADSKVGQKPSMFRRILRELQQLRPTVLKHICIALKAPSRRHSVVFQIAIKICLKTDSMANRPQLRQTVSKSSPHWTYESVTEIQTCS